MKIRPILLAPLALALAVPATAPASRRVSRPEDPAPVVRPSLRPRTVARTGGRIDGGPLTRVVVVKFREGLEATVANGALALKSATGASAVAAISRAAVAGGVAQTFGDSAETLRAESAKAKAESGIDLADLSLYVDVETATPEDALRLAVQLETLDDVECAYVKPAPPPLPPVRRAASVPAPAHAAAAPATPDFTSEQRYLEKSSIGFGILPARDEPGGRGEGVRIVDIEYSWNLDHEDMPFATRPGQLFLDERGVDPVADDHGNHGTAALGMLVAADNGYGTTGICPDAMIGVINPVTSKGIYALASAIRRATNALTADGKRGDIIQIEQQSRGINTEIAALPSEYDPEVFSAIQYAVARGLVVIEPAGNGGFNDQGKAKGVSLDRAELQGKFDRTKQDSGAIIVGGADPFYAIATQTTNYGSRIDVQGHGIHVTTLGYGDKYGGKKKKSRRFAYTGIFEGTSSATPCVTGVAALVQASIRARGLFELDSFQMRAVLAGTGAPDNSPRTRPLGPRPNALAAITGTADPAVPLVTGAAFDEKTGALTVDGLYFLAANAAPENQSVIYINGAAVATQYVDGFPGPGGTTTTRVVAVGVSDLLLQGAITIITVGNAAGPLSPPRVFVRK